jgi:hypothetical protein
LFRITTDDFSRIHFIHRKFLWFWVKWSLIKTNATKNNFAELDEILHHMEIGSYDFSRGEHSNYWILLDGAERWGSVEIEYVKNAKEYKVRHADKFI